MARPPPGGFSMAALLSNPVPAAALRPPAPEFLLAPATGFPERSASSVFNSKRFPFEPQISNETFQVGKEALPYFQRGSERSAPRLAPNEALHCFTTSKAEALRLPVLGFLLAQAIGFPAGSASLLCIFWKRSAPPFSVERSASLWKPRFLRPSASVVLTRRERSALFLAASGVEALPSKWAGPGHKSVGWNEALPSIKPGQKEALRCSAPFGSEALPLLTLATISPARRQRSASLGNIAQGFPE